LRLARRASRRDRRAGRHGGAQPLAPTDETAAAFLGVDVDVSRIQRRVGHGYCDRISYDLDESSRLLETARARRVPLSVGLVANIATVLPELVRRGGRRRRRDRPDLGARPARGVYPVGLSLEQAAVLRESDPAGYESRVLDSMVTHVRAMLSLQRAGAVAFDYGNNLRGQVSDHRGMLDAFDIPGFVPAFIRPLFCRGAGPFRWVALSGDPADIAVTDEAVLETFPQKEPLARWIRKAKEKVHFQACPRGYAGSNTASAPRWASASTGW
jgi:urocanate hydratase